MKIAIFGATGIVGSAITKEALAQGFEVTVLTRDAKKVKETGAKLRECLDLTSIHAKRIF